VSLAGRRLQLLSRVTSRRSRIFIVDDHPLVREWLGSLVARESDLEVCGQAEDPAKALALLGTANADIAVVDLSLSRSSGLTLIKDIRLQYPGVRILVLSMHEEISFPERAFRAGARGYVLKRESGSCVIAAIRAILAGQFYASQSLAAELAGRLAGAAERVGDSPDDVLSDRELEVLELRGAGRTAKAIAEHLNVSVKTVESYEGRIKQKLGLQNATELMREGVRWRERNHRA
jgi:DNA-binding NarL/FixJ family response regulator